VLTAELIALLGTGPSVGARVCKLSNGLNPEDAAGIFCPGPKLRFGPASSSLDLFEAGKESIILLITNKRRMKNTYMSKR
jgi:hypothetical protein